MFLSIVIPVYKTEKYLRECLDSCLNQDISPDDYEIICVDDGSPDNCGKIIDEYARKDKRIVPVHKKNAGVGAARNSALDIIRGDYVWCVDSDDFIEENILGEIKSFIGAGQERVIVGLYHLKTDVMSDEESEMRKAGSLPCDKTLWLGREIFKGSIIRDNNVRFNTEISLNEDTLFDIDYDICQTVPTVFFDRISYFYRTNQSSLCHSNYEKVLPSYFGLILEMQKYAERGYAEKFDTDYWILLHIYRSVDAIVRLDFSKRRKYLGMMKEKGLFPFRVDENVRQKLIDEGIKFDKLLYEIEMDGKGYRRYLIHMKKKLLSRKLRGIFH